jgi:hypothetical protein
MFYYLYEIKNLINGKIYVGVHKTRDMNDGYMGSGKVIRSAIKRYGVENFQKVILETFVDAKSMYAREREVVTEEFLSRDDVYNLRRGGTGGFDYINAVGKNLNGSQLYVKCLTHPNWHREISSRGGREASSKQIRNKTGLHNGNFCGFKSKEHELKARFAACSPAAITKKKETMRRNLHQQGKNNSQYGTIWITDGTQNMKIKKSNHIPDGWEKGRHSK